MSRACCIPSIHPSIYLSIYLFIYLSIYLFIYIHMYLPIVFLFSFSRLPFPIYLSIFPRGTGPAADQRGHDRVLVTFAPGVAFDGTVLFEAVRFRKRLAAADDEPRQRLVDAPSPSLSCSSLSSSSSSSFSSFSSSSSSSSPSSSSCSPSSLPHNPPRSVDPTRDDSPYSRKSEGFRFWSAFAFQTSSSSLL